MPKIGIQQYHGNVLEVSPSVMVITGTGCGLKVVSSSPASVNFSQSLLRQDTKPLIALCVCASRPSLHTPTFIHMHVSYCIVCALGMCAEQMLYTCLL